MLLTLLVQLRHVISDKACSVTCKITSITASNLWLIKTIMDLCNYQPWVICHSLRAINYAELLTSLLYNKHIKLVVIVLWHIEHYIRLVKTIASWRSDLNLMYTINLNVPLNSKRVNALITLSLLTVYSPHVHKCLGHVWSCILWIEVCYDAHTWWFIQKCYPRGSLSSCSCSLSSCKFRLSHLVPFKRALISWSKSTTL